LKIVLDTNVFYSGIFFSDPPFQILQAWRGSNIKLVISPEIFDEYLRIGDELAEQFPNIDIEPFINLVESNAEFVHSPNLPNPICSDPDDDKFIACALAGNAKIIVSGDKHLLKVSGYRQIEVIKPRSFIDQYLKDENKRSQSETGNEMS